MCSLNNLHVLWGLGTCSLGPWNPGTGFFVCPRVSSCGATCILPSIDWALPSTYITSSPAAHTDRTSPAQPTTAAPSPPPPPKVHFTCSQNKDPACVHDKPHKRDVPGSSTTPAAVDPDNRAAGAWLGGPGVGCPAGLRRTSLHMLLPGVPVRLAHTQAVYATKRKEPRSTRPRRKCYQPDSSLSHNKSSNPQAERLLMHLPAAAQKLGVRQQSLHLPAASCAPCCRWLMCSCQAPL
jgi:hypothetical protein